MAGKTGRVLARINQTLMVLFGVAGVMLLLAAGVAYLHDSTYRDCMNRELPTAKARQEKLRHPGPGRVAAKNTQTQEEGTLSRESLRTSDFLYEELTDYDLDSEAFSKAWDQCHGDEWRSDGALAIAGGVSLPLALLLFGVGKWVAWLAEA